MELLEGEEPEAMKEERTLEIGEMRQEEIGIEEVKNAIKKLKVKKAAGADGIPMKAWKFAGTDVINELTDLINAVWMQGVLPNDWKMGIILPLYKRGEKDDVTNYRGISLLCSA